MRNELPVAIACISGFAVLIAHFFEIAAIQTFAGNLQGWAIVVAAFAIVVSALSLIVVNVKRISQSKGDFWKVVNSLVTVSLFLITAVSGLMSRDNHVFTWLFDYAMKPLGVTFVSINMFYLATAAYRAFRAHSMEAALLLAAGIIVLLGSAPIIAAKLGWIANLSAWVMKIPNMAGRRGLLMGAAIGGIQTAIRIICGIDRSYSASS